jgi:hypothetical protein
VLLKGGGAPLRHQCGLLQQQHLVVGNNVLNQQQLLQHSRWRLQKQGRGGRGSSSRRDSTPGGIPPEGDTATASVAGPAAGKAAAAAEGGHT